MLNGGLARPICAHHSAELFVAHGRGEPEHQAEEALGRAVETLAAAIAEEKAQPFCLAEELRSRGVERGEVACPGPAAFSRIPAPAFVRVDEEKMFRPRV